MVTPAPAEALAEAGTTPPRRPGSTRGASSRPDLDPVSDPRTFPCPRCGADLQYYIGREALRCQHCGHVEKLELEREELAERNYEERLRDIEELRREALEPLPETRVDCDSCGAEVVFAGTLTSLECAYCGSPVQRPEVHRAQSAEDGDGRHRHRVPVDGVLPFSVDRETAHQHLDRWLKRLWFAPGSFVRHGIRGRLHGVYLPYYSFDSLTFTRFRGQRGDHHYVGSGKNRKRKTRWRRVGGSFQRFFDDVLTLACSEAADPLLLRLEPWPLEDCVPFRSELLAGLEARTYDVELEHALVDARTRMDQALEQETRRRIGGDTQRIHERHSTFDAVTYKHLLLPLWLMSYRFHGKVYRVVVNARTGEVHGTRPWSVVKITLLVAFLAIVALVLIVALR